MGNCRDCKRWGDPAPQVMATRKGIVQLKRCDEAEFYAFDTEIGGGKMTEHYNLPICTPPDFGCVQFEPKDPA